MFAFSSLVRTSSIRSDVDTDEPEPEHEDELDEGQLRNLVVDLDMSTEADHVVSFMDIDGETVSSAHLTSQ